MLVYSGVVAVASSLKFSQLEIGLYRIFYSYSIRSE